MAELGRAPLTPDPARLRLVARAVMGRLAAAAWPASIPDPLPVGEALDKPMLDSQAGLKGELNGVWAEKARLAARPR